ncbi:MAG: hypothetical protein SGCHY_001632, partial [Lobulomycetales sp.]
MKIVLASKSPRRLEILQSIGIHPEIVDSGFAEDHEKANLSASEYVLQTAISKGRAAGEAYEASKVDLLIAADTVVRDPDGNILEKAQTGEDAVRMLKRLENRTHTVLTAVVMLVGGPSSESFQEVSFVESTSVSFGSITKDDLDAYIASRDWEDKAGAYGYQSLAKRFVKEINGCYYNVV